jgi:hypothetical protein
MEITLPKVSYKLLFDWQWRTEGEGLAPSPRSFEKADPNSLFREKYIRTCLMFLFHHPN